jgi:protein required for attachment to host cells
MNTWIIVADGGQAHILESEYLNKTWQKIQILTSENGGNALAHDIALLLKERQHSYGRLVLVAPLQMLGDLRAALDESLHARVIAEVRKDFTCSASNDFSSQSGNSMHLARRKG